MQYDLKLIINFTSPNLNNCHHKKNALLTFLFISILSLSTYSQWEFQNPSHTNEEFNDIQFVDTNHGWAVGEYGTILHSNDGGNTWINQHSNSVTITGFHNYQGVYFTDIVNGWVAGWYITEDSLLSSCLMHTADGGNNWELQFSNSNEEFLDVWFTDPLNGWLVGAVDQSDGFIRYTEDGGNSWSDNYILEGGYLRSICFVDENNGWIGGDNGNILHTSDGGENWVDQFSGIYTSFKSVCFTDLDNGWVVGVNSNPSNFKLYQTTNGGTTWFENTTSSFDIGNIFFIDSNNGWYSTRDYGCGMYLPKKTSDGGVNWNWINIDQPIHSLLKFFFIDSNNGWAIGENLILHSSDGGLNWEMQNSASNAEFKSVFFTDPENGWALGEKSHETGEWSASLILLHTNNGGSNWQIEEGGYYDDFSNSRVNSLYFIDQNIGWATLGKMYDPCMILKTVNGGLDWEEINLTIFFNPIFFIDSLHGWATGRHSENGNGLNGTWHSNDGGYNWSQQFFAPPDSPLHSIEFQNLNEGWAVGSYFTNTAFILHTDNGGINWEVQLYDMYDPLRSVTFVDSELGWAVGDSGTILHTTDGGDNWVQQICPSEFDDFTLKSVNMFDSEKGWIAGSLDSYWGNSHSSLILSTNDGGETWEEQFYRPYSGLTSIQFIDSENGWVVGSGGTIMHTNNGGITEVPNTQIPNSKIHLLIYPNPIDMYTNIEFEIPESGLVYISIFELSGKLCKKIISDEMVSGTHQLQWDAEGLLPGVYLCTLKTNTGIQTKKIIKL